jgi:hypothetical protein
MAITLLAAKATQPDSDGDARFEASLTHKNETESTIELLHVRMLVTDPNGAPLGEAEEDIEELIPPGETGRLSISSYRIPYPIGNVTNARLTITIVPMACTFLDLGKLSIPNEPGGISNSSEERSSNGLTVKRWSCLRRRDDRDGDVTVEANAWLENGSGNTIHRAVMKLQTYNYSGRPLNDTESRDDRLLFDGIPAIINDSLYCKSSQLKDASISATLRGYTPLSTKSIQITELQLDR